MVIDHFGGPEEFHRVQIPIPSPGEREVVVKNAAIGANPLDYKMRDGSSGLAPSLTFPCVLGREAAGTVISVGSAVTEFAVGDRVFGMRVAPDIRGTYASHSVFDASNLAHTPDSLGDAPAAALSVAALTARVIVEDLAQPTVGDVVLIHGAGGGVGQIVTQLCVQRGATVVASASSRHAEKLKRFGAHHLDYTQLNVFDEVRTRYPGGVDKVIDGVYFGTAEADLTVVRPGGTVVFIPTLADTTPAEQRGIDVRVPSVQWDTQAAEELAEAVARGELELPIGLECPLSEVAQVHRILEDGHANGKIVMTV